MRQYTILQPIFLAFYAKKLYQDVRQNWPLGLAFAYLLVLTAICSVLVACPIYNSFQRMATYGLPILINQLPSVTVLNGKININKPLPYYIKSADEKYILVIFATSAEVVNFNHSPARVFVTENSILLKNKQGAIITKKLPNLQNGSYDLMAMGNKIIKHSFAIMSFLIYPIIVLGYFILGLLEAIIYAGLAKLFTRTTLTYALLLRLAIFALTPKFIVVALMNLFAIAVPFKWAFYFALGMLYLFFAIEANKPATPIGITQ